MAKIKVACFFLGHGVDPYADWTSKKYDWLSQQLLRYLFLFSLEAFFSVLFQFSFANHFRSSFCAEKETIFAPVHKITLGLGVTAGLESLLSCTIRWRLVFNTLTQWLVTYKCNQCSDRSLFITSSLCDKIIQYHQKLCQSSVHVHCISPYL